MLRPSARGAPHVSPARKRWENWSMKIKRRKCGTRFVLRTPFLNKFSKRGAGSRREYSSASRELCAMKSLFDFNLGVSNYLYSWHFRHAKSLGLRGGPFFTPPVTPQSDQSTP